MIEPAANDRPQPEPPIDPPWVTDAPDFVCVNCDDEIKGEPYWTPEEETVCGFCASEEDKQE